MAERKADLLDAMRGAPRVVFVTFTYGHESPVLSTEWDRLDGIRVRFTERGSWSRFKKRHGITGYALSTDLTYSRDGWHPHMHAVFILSAHLTPRALRMFQEAITARWVAAAAHTGANASAANQTVSLVPNVDYDRIADYLTHLNLMRNEMVEGVAPPGYFLKRSYEDFSDLDSYLLWHEYRTAARGRTAIAQYGAARGTRRALRDQNPPPANFGGLEADTT